MKSFIGLLPFLMVVMMISACNVSSVNLPGTKWELKTLNGKAVLTETAVTMNFGPDGQLNGSDGCNHYTGTYTVNGSQLKLSLGASTMMACEEAVMNQANDFSTALSASHSYTLQNDTLVLKDASGKELATFTTFKPTSLQDTPWEALFVNNGKQAAVSVQLDTKITAEFKKDGSLSGNSGCNTYHTTYKIDGNKITIQPAATTRMACPQSVMDQEQQYLTALTNSTTLELGKGSLELRDADGALQVSFQAAK